MKSLIYTYLQICINMQNSEKRKMFIKAHFPKYYLREAVEGLTERNRFLGFVTNVFRRVS